MMKVKDWFKPFLLVIVCLFLFSCKNNQEFYDSSEDAIKDVKERFPTLIYSSKKKVQDVSIRKISIENDSIEINLIEFQGDDDENRILVFKNKYNHYYSIPLFSTIHRDYWNFKNDTILTQFPKVNSTFLEEFLNMMRVLKFNNKYDFWKIYHETFISVLGWDYIESKEELTKRYKLIYANSNKLIEDEDFEKSNKRIDKNISDLENSYKQNETYLFNGKGIIIEFYNIHNYIFKKEKLGINCYRQDSNLNSMRL